jgi:hypothetical protein
MPTRSRKKDENEIAASVVAQATGTVEKAMPPEKNPAAVALGRLGGKKGGVARAKALTAKRRREIASKAAAARWVAHPKKKRTP